MVLWVSLPPYKKENPIASTCLLLITLSKKGTVMDDHDHRIDKTLEFLNYKKYGSKDWRSLKMVMKNLQTGKSTTLDWSDYSINLGLAPSDFNKNSLMRAR